MGGWGELRAKWNAYDPIGVMADPDWPRDEYEAYIGPTMRLLERNAPIEDHLRHMAEASEHMGLDFDLEAARRHAHAFMRWYEDRWRDTRVWSRIESWTQV